MVLRNQAFPFFKDRGIAIPAGRSSQEYLSLGSGGNWLANLMCGIRATDYGKLHKEALLTCFSTSTN